MPARASGCTQWATSADCSVLMQWDWYWHQRMQTALPDVYYDNTLFSILSPDISCRLRQSRPVKCPSLQKGSATKVRSLRRLRQVAHRASHQALPFHLSIDHAASVMRSSCTR